MTITVKFFASLREKVGKAEVKLTTTDSLNIEQVWQQACGDILPLPEQILMSLNLEYVSKETIVQDGDEVAFFPPVTGG